MDPDLDPNLQHWQDRLDNFQWVIGSIASVTVSCNAGEAAVGGGGTPNDGNWATLLSRPQNSTGGTTGTPTQWRVDFGNYNDTTNAGAIPVAYAVCENG